MRGMKILDLALACLFLSASAEAARLTVVTQNVGRYQFESNIFMNSQIKARLVRMMGMNYYQTFLQNISVAGPLRIVPLSDIFYMGGNRPHMGGEEMSLFIYDARRDDLQVYLLTNGKTLIFKEKGVVRAEHFDQDLQGLVLMMKGL